MSSLHKEMLNDHALAEVNSQLEDIFCGAPMVDAPHFGRESKVFILNRCEIETAAIEQGGYGLSTSACTLINIALGVESGKHFNHDPYKTLLSQYPAQVDLQFSRRTANFDSRSFPLHGSVLVDQTKIKGSVRFGDGPEIQVPSESVTDIYVHREGRLTHAHDGPMASYRIDRNTNQCQYYLPLWTDNGRCPRSIYYPARTEMPFLLGGEDTGRPFESLMATLDIARQIAGRIALFNVNMQQG